MSEYKTYRHKVTGLVASMSELTASAMPDVLVEVTADAKPLVPLGVRHAGSKPEIKKEKKDG